ncbi:MAG TPA: phosphotransferase family protein [Rubrobacteraceae bacterium]|nr:phosphotransferase family protein [Rubrobacteraceae bacterium]
MQTEELDERLTELLGTTVEVEDVVLLGGGASKEAWKVDASTPEGGLELLVRRASGGNIYSDTLSLGQEYKVLQAAYEWGVKVPKPYGYLEDLGGREAFVMERLEGESIGRRLVRKEEFEATREALPEQLAEELCKIHAVPFERLPFLPGAQDEPAAAYNLESLERELDLLEEPHPVIELGLSWLCEHVPESHGIVLNHGDFRIGNFLVDEEDLVGVVDWEFAHLGDPAEDLGWPLVRAWRFGKDHLRLGGINEVEPFLERYNTLTEREITKEELFYWEVLGNVRWVIGSYNQAKRHLSGQERSVELAILGRLAAEVEYEILSLLERGG